jgi:ABC-2 type transport system ATP-binding protein
MAELLAAGSGSHVRVRSPQAGQLSALLHGRGAAITRLGDGALAVTGITADAVGELARASGITLAELSPQQASLEDRYMELTRDTADYHATAPAPGPAAARK